MNYPIQSNDLIQLLDNLSKVTTNFLQEREDQATNMIPISRLREFFPLDKVKTDQEFYHKIEAYLQHATNVQSKYFMGHQVSAPSLGSIAADIILSLSNNSAAVYDMGAAGVAIEDNLIRYINGKIGWGEESGGIFTHGGSLSLFSAILAARAYAQKDVWTKGVKDNLVGFVPEISHYSVTRSFSMLGLGSERVVKVKVDDRGKMILSDLESKLSKTIEEGKKPFILVANAGSTVLGSFDDLEQIATLRDKYKFWFHVDGAHGGSSLLSKTYRHLLQGIQLADSITWDAHKMLQCSALTAMLLFRDKSRMALMFNQDASYLDGANEEEYPNIFPYTFECTKPVNALKLYLHLILEGEDGIDRIITDLYHKAKEFRDHINAQADFSSPLSPQANILIFKYQKSDNQKEIYKKIIKHGKFHITYTEFKREGYLRLTIMNPKTTIHEINELLNLIRPESKF